MRRTLFRDIEPTPEEIEKILQEAYKKITKYKMETMAILTLESIKPLSYVGGELLRAALAPIIPVLGENMSSLSEKILLVFEKRDNIERLIQMLEENLDRAEAERRAKKKEKARKKAVKKELKEAEKNRGA